MYASQLSTAGSYRPDLGASWDIPKIYWTAFPKSVIRAGIEALQDLGDDSDFASMDPDDMPFACPDDSVTTSVDISQYLPNKVAAMRAHASQISLEEGFFSLSNNVGSPIFSREYFRLVKGEPGGTLDEEGRETGLFG